MAYWSAGVSLSVHGALDCAARVPRVWFGAALAALSVVGACNVSTPTDALSTSAPTLVSLTSGALQTGTAGGPLANPIVVKVVDQFGLAVKGTVLTFTPNATSGSVNAVTATSDSTGSASVTWTLGTAVGTDSLTVTSGALAPVTVLAIAHAGQPAAVSIVSGSGQSAKAGSLLGAPFVLKLTDQYGNPASNATVTWSSDAAGTFAATTTISDAFGLAQNTYTLGATPGRQNIVAVIVTNTNTVLVSTLFATAL